MGESPSGQMAREDASFGERPPRGGAVSPRGTGQESAECVMTGRRRPGRSPDHAAQRAGLQPRRETHDGRRGLV